MTKKHFIAVAAILKAQQGEASIVIAHKLAVYFKTINPLFDHSRFIKAATSGDSA